MNTYETPWEKVIGWGFVIAAIIAAIVVPPTHPVVFTLWIILAAGITLLTALRYGTRIRKITLSDFNLISSTTIVVTTLAVIATHLLSGWIVVAIEFILTVWLGVSTWVSLRQDTSPEVTVINTLPLILLVTGMGIHPNADSYMVFIQLMLWVISVVVLIYARWNAIMRL